MIFKALLFLSCIALWANSTVYVATYNVENLFDDVNDPGRDDDWVFSKTWDKQIYEAKLHNLARVISAMNDGKGPDVLGFQEVENLKVLEDLVKLLPNGGDYRIIHHDSDASRGIDVALISRFPVKKYRSHYVYRSIRDILEVDLDIHGVEVKVLVNHWKSRYGGALQSANTRYFCAARAYQLYMEAIRLNRDAAVILLGDFNDTPVNLSVSEVLNAKTSKGKVLAQHKRHYLFNLVGDLENRLVDGPNGTYYYGGDRNWSYLDQIMVSKACLTEEGIEFVDGSTEVFVKSFMMQDGEPLGFDRKTKQGFADHLPLVAKFRVNRP
ncbi:MAG: endonuclease/exonuclease/phosphatase family protein [Lentisphaeria bacterium]|nr:endonuclease/exonuclease/phosphatase family protein [Lentisphaeria bacterium]